MQEERHYRSHRSHSPTENEEHVKREFRVLAIREELGKLVEKTKQQSSHGAVWYRRLLFAVCECIRDVTTTKQVNSTRASEQPAIHKETAMREESAQPKHFHHVLLLVLRLPTTAAPPVRACVAYPPGDEHRQLAR
jgi:hypothetical protein